MKPVELRDSSSAERIPYATFPTEPPPLLTISFRNGSVANGPFDATNYGEKTLDRVAETDGNPACTDTYHDLSRVVAAWPYLALETRNALLAIVDAIVSPSGSEGERQ